MTEQQDWTDRLDNCDVCEVCGNLVGAGRLGNRISHAITLLYTHGLLNAAQRDKARSHLKKRAGTIVSI